MVALRRALILAGALALAACGTNPNGPSLELTSIDLVVGTGTEATVGRLLNVHYTGWLYDPLKPDFKGKQFDTTDGRNPLGFIMGANPKQVIAGWDIGLLGMRAGGTRRLIIPPDLAYGAAGAGDIIPPNSALIFDIQLIGVF